MQSISDKQKRQRHFTSRKLESRGQIRLVKVTLYVYLNRIRNECLNLENSHHIQFALVDLESVTCTNRRKFVDIVIDYPHLKGNAFSEVHPLTSVKTA